MKRYGLILMGIVGAVQGALGGATWKNAGCVANTPDTAYLWSDAENWEEDSPDFTSGTVAVKPATEPIFIKMPDGGVTVEKLESTGRAYFLGDLNLLKTTLERGMYYGAGCLYGTITVPQAETALPYFCGNICGRLRHEGPEGTQITVPSGSLNFHFNRYATAAGESRTDDFEDLNYFGIGNGTITYYMPDYSEASSSVWVLTKGSPFAYRKDKTEKSVLSVGTLVTAADYLAEGTFLKNVFNANTIELSAPAVEDGEATLSFAAFHPAFHPVYKNRFRVQGGDMTLIAQVNDTRNMSVIEMTDLSGSYDKTHLTFGAATNGLPGRFLIRAFSGGFKSGWCAFQNTHLILAGKVGETTMQVGANHPLMMPLAGVKTILEVPEGMITTLGVMTNFNGVLVKEGLGELIIGLNDMVGRGSITLNAGTLKFVRNAAVAADAEFVLGDVVLQAGTTLYLPSEGAYATSFKANGAVTIKGGTLKVHRVPGAYTAADWTNVTFAEGGNLAFQGDGECTVLTSTPASEVVGHPAFWVDASDANSIEYETAEDGSMLVTKWKDHRTDETMFCTNIGTAHALYTNGTSRFSKYVAIRKNATATDYADTEQLVWNVPLYDVRAVFLVQDPVDGGGEILGRCSWRLDDDVTWSWGGPFYREGKSNTRTSPIVSDSEYTPPSVLKGKFYLDGEEYDALHNGYPQAGVQLIECHVNPNEYSRKYAPGLACDAFGGGYKNENNSVRYANGGLRISECIIYTNSLSYAERVKVAKYLMQKWLKRNVYYVPTKASFAEPEAGVDDLSDIAGKEGSSLNVAANKTIVAEPLTSGTLVKEGAGMVYFADGITGGTLDIRGGTVRVDAFSRARFMPNDTWLHVDATETSSIETAADGETLVKWNDIRGTGGSLRNYPYSSATRVVKVAQNAIGGKPAIDIGEMGSVSAAASALLYYTPDGEKAANYDNYGNTLIEEPRIKTFFAVYNSSSGGGAIFGGTGNSYPMKGFMRAGYGDNVPMIYDTSYQNSNYFGMPQFSTALANETSFYWRNGVSINPFESYFLKGDERVTIALRHIESSGDVGRFCLAFGAYGQSAEYKGGLKYGELALYPRALTDAEISRVEAYLAHKWFGTENTTYATAATAVKVAAGATFAVEGEGFTTGALGGSGTVTGEVALNANGIVYAATSANGNIAGLTVNGDLTLDGGTVILDSTAAKANSGEYAILTATKLTNAGGTWNVVGSPRCKYRAYVVDNALMLEVYDFGTVIFVK